MFECFVDILIDIIICVIFEEEDVVYIEIKNFDGEINLKFWNGVLGFFYFNIVEVCVNVYFCIDLDFFEFNMFWLNGVVMNFDEYDEDE